MGCGNLSTSTEGCAATTAKSRPISSQVPTFTAQVMTMAGCGSASHVARGLDVTMATKSLSDVLRTKSCACGSRKHMPPLTAYGNTKSRNKGLRKRQHAALPINGSANKWAYLKRPAISECSASSNVWMSSPCACPSNENYGGR